MLLEVVEASSPHPTVTFKPELDDVKAGGIDAVQATLRVGADAHESDIAQHLEMLRDSRLRQLELGYEVADGLLAVRQLLDDREPGLIRQCRKGSHPVVISCSAYMRQARSTDSCNHARSADWWRSRASNGCGCSTGTRVTHARTRAGEGDLFADQTRPRSRF